MPAFNITQRISVSGDNIDIPLLKESVERDDYDHIIHKTKDGGTAIYVRATQKEWNLDVICTEAEATTKIASWISARSQVVFTPDLVGAPGTTHNTRIINPVFPMSHWGAGKWRGTLRLRKE